MRGSDSQPTLPGIVPPRWAPWIIVGTILAPAFVLTQADPDLWGHVRFGLDILKDRALPTIDPYSFTQDVPWMNHEWLSELLMGAVYRAGGATALAVLKGVLVATCFGVVLSAYSEVSPPVLALVILVTAAGTGRLITTLRPQLWSLLGVAVLCRVLVTPPRRYWLIALPLLFMLWSNFHGGWIVGAAILAVWAGVQFLTSGTSRPFILALCLLSAAGTLINPYGWHLWQFLYNTVGMSRRITEWRPLLTAPVIAWLPWLVALLAVALSVVSRTRPPIERLIAIAVLAYLSFRVQRVAPLCVVATVVLMSPTVAARWRAPSWAFDPVSSRLFAGFVIAVVVLVVLSGVLAAKAASCISVAGNWIPDRVVGRALVAGHRSGTIVTWFDWGEYAIWHLSPALRVSLDGRRETIYSDAVLRNHEALNAATPEGLAYLRRLDPTYVWLPSSDGRLAAWLEMNGYRLDVRTPESFVAVRADKPMLVASDSPATNCFPGP